MATAPNHARTIQWLESTSQWLGKRSSLAHGQAQELRRASDSMRFTAPVADRVRVTIAGTVKNLDSIVRFLHDLSLYTRKEAARLADIDARAKVLASQTQGTVTSGLAPVTAESGLYLADPAKWADTYFPSPQASVDLVLVADGIELEAAPGGASPGGFAGHVSFEMPSVRATADVLVRTSRALQDHQTALLRQLHTVPEDMAHHLHGSLGRTRRDLPAKFERQALRLTRQANLLVRRMSIEDLFPTGNLSGPVPLLPPAYEWADPVMSDRMRRPSYEEILTAFVEAVELLVRPHFEWQRPMARTLTDKRPPQQEAIFREAVRQFIEAVGQLRTFTGNEQLPTWPPLPPSLVGPPATRPDPTAPTEPDRPVEGGGSPGSASFSPERPVASGGNQSGSGAGSVIPGLVGGAGSVIPGLVGGAVAGTAITAATGGTGVPAEDDLDTVDVSPDGAETSASEPTVGTLSVDDAVERMRRLRRSTVDTSDDGKKTDETHPSRGGMGPGLAGLGVATVTGGGGVALSRRRQRQRPTDFASFVQQQDDNDNDTFEDPTDD